MSIDEIIMWLFSLLVVAFWLGVIAGGRRADRAWRASALSPSHLHESRGLWFAVRPLRPGSLKYWPG